MNYEQGAVLTHENLIANVAGSSINVKFHPSDVLVSIVLSHHLTDKYFSLSLLKSASIFSVTYRIFLWRTSMSGPTKS